MDLSTSDYEESVFSAKKKHGHGDYAYSRESSEDWVDTCEIWALWFSLLLLKQVYVSSPTYRNYEDGFKNKNKEYVSKINAL